MQNCKENYFDIFILCKMVCLLLLKNKQLTSVIQSSLPQTTYHYFADHITC
jgi:hypothetical protein